MSNQDVSLEDLLCAACVLEATARKPGNVHPEAAFSDLTYNDFVLSAQAAAPILSHAFELGVGRTIFEAVAATRKAIASNSNLGMILLLAPLAAVPRDQPLIDGISDILDTLSVEDAVWAYRGIRLAKPGGMGEAVNQDISSEPTITLRDAMKLADDRDLVAAQYNSKFSLVLNEGVRWLTENCDFEGRPEIAVIRLQLRLLAGHPDSLIARKCGLPVALEASERAGRVLESGWPDSSGARESLAEFDQWLRADGHRRNPGTTADLIAATLFASFRENVVEVKSTWGITTVW